MNLLRYPATLGLAAALLALPVFQAPTVEAATARQSATPAAANAVARVRTRIEAAIDPDTGRGAIRLPAISMNRPADLTVVLALREEDVFAVLRAVYADPSADVETTTVVGTYSVTGTRGPRELPVLRAVLSADRAAAIDWTAARPQDLDAAADVYRLFPPFGDDEGNPVAPAATPAASPVTASAATDAAEAPISSSFDIGGRLLFLRCIGSGRPTVILAAGYGDDGTIWAPVRIHASELGRVCSYDRAGLARSHPPDHYPWTGAEVVADLHALLAAADVAPPYLLVGQSYGALFTRLFAATYPDDVAGLLLLDPWPEDYDQKLQAMVTPEQWTDYERVLASDPDNEVIDFAATGDEVKAAGPLPDVPLLVVSHGQPPTADCCPPGWPVAQQERLWQDLQQRLAALTPEGEQRVVPASGHVIHQAAPAVVVEAIREMVDRLR